MQDAVQPHLGMSGKADSTLSHAFHEAVGQHAVKGAQHLVVTHHHRHVGAQRLEDAGQLHSNVATAHHHCLPAGTEGNCEEALERLRGEFGNSIVNISQFLPQKLYEAASVITKLHHGSQYVSMYVCVLSPTAHAV